MWQAQNVMLAPSTPRPLDPASWISALATGAVAFLAIIELWQVVQHRRRRRHAADLSIRSGATVLRSDTRLAHRPSLRRDAPGFLELAPKTLTDLLALEPRFASMAQHFTDASGSLALRAGEAYSLFNRSVSYLQRVVATFPQNNADEAFTVATEQNLKACVRILFEIGDGPEWDLTEPDAGSKGIRAWLKRHTGRRLQRGSSD